MSLLGVVWGYGDVAGTSTRWSPRSIRLSSGSGYLIQSNPPPLAVYPFIIHACIMIHACIIGSEHHQIGQHWHWCIATCKG